MLVLELDFGIFDESHNGLIVDKDLTSGTLYALGGSLVHDLGHEVASPAGGAVLVATLQASHHLVGDKEENKNVK